MHTGVNSNLLAVSLYCPCLFSKSWPLYQLALGKGEAYLELLWELLFLITALLSEVGSNIGFIHCCHGPEIN